MYIDTRSYGNYECTYVYTHVYRTLRSSSRMEIAQSKRSTVSLTILDRAGSSEHSLLKYGPARVQPHEHARYV